MFGWLCVLSAFAFECGLHDFGGWAGWWFCGIDVGRLLDGFVMYLFVV